MIVSIDIGTSYSSMCMLGEDGKPKPVDIGTGVSIYGSKYSLPSAVYVEDDGRILVGQSAMNSRKKNPRNFRMEFKRDLGQDIPIYLGQVQFKPEDLYTELFRHMKARVRKVRDEEIDKVYLTHPASFRKNKQERILSAARAAGLFHVELVDEPTAAAMSYCQEGVLKDGQAYMIYDFGGGTFDVSLLRYQDGAFVRLTEPKGIEQCGGIDINRMIFNDMLSYVAETDEDILRQMQENKKHRIRVETQLSELATKAKHHLSDAEKFEEEIPIGWDMIPYELTVGKLNYMMAGLVNQTIEACNGILKDAGMETAELSSVLMVGGSSRIPLAQEMVKKFAGEVPVFCSGDMELAVAKGALDFCGYLKEEKEQKGIYVGGWVKNKDFEGRDSYKVVATNDNHYGKCDIGGWRDIVEIAYGLHYMVGLRKDGTVVDTVSPHMRNSAYKEDDYDVREWKNIRNWRDIVEIACGFTHTVGLRKDGTAVAVWEHPRYKGECNIGDWGDIVGVDCGAEHTVGLKKDGTVVAVGNNERGQCNVRNWRDIVKVVCGNWHTIGLRKDGTTIAVGLSNDYIWDVGNWRDIVEIACGLYQTVGLKKDGTVVAAGWNSDGECDVRNWRDIVGIACGGCLIAPYTVGLKKDGTVVAVGNNEYGQCDVGNWRDIVGITCGDGHTVGLKKDGTVVAVGNNKYGQCDVGNWRDIVKVVCGPYHTTGLRKDGKI